MLVWLAELEGTVSWLRVFQYVTFRAFAGAATAFGVSLLVGRAMIGWLRAMKIGQQVRRGGEWAAIGHGGKQGTPTMGGLLILATATGAALLWCDLDNAAVWRALATQLKPAASMFGSAQARRISASARSPLLVKPPGSTA